MNKDSSLSLLRLIIPAGSLLISSLLGSPSVNPVHPPPSTASTSETLGPANHPGTPVFTILSLTGKQPFGLSTPLWQISPSIHWYPGSSSLHISLHCK
ncbi:hypothetical protein CHARACLAT_014214 [Characodon lateralis]|uniref:Secreted protein n=1 Tax=Characodon lateralis TaxID=208331 RepID=A0ABU7CZG4_9TELE|nr:hypothetical protein [Characodon lateralis]